jgi:hypothetical protein
MKMEVELVDEVQAVAMEAEEVVEAAAEVAAEVAAAEEEVVADEYTQTTGVLTSGIN